MTKVFFNDDNTTATRKFLDSLMLIRANTIEKRQPINRAIRQYCKDAIAGTTYPNAVKTLAYQISGKALCEVELLKAVDTYNQLLSGELEVLIDGVVAGPTNELTNPIK